MASNLFSGSIWTDQELLDLLKQLERMYAQGTRLAMYKDQQLQFASTRELEQRITMLRNELCDRGALTGATPRKKQVRITTRNRGFNSVNTQN